MTTLQQQRSAIRMAVKALEYEIKKLITDKGLQETDETIIEIRAEIEALKDASEALRAAESFKSSMKSFLGV
jgi:hypothetical protein